MQKDLEICGAEQTENPDLIRITFDGRRWYKYIPTNKYVPSCTWILSYYPKGIGFEMYLAGLGSYDESREIMKRAGERGERIHFAINRLLRKGGVLEHGCILEEYGVYVPLTDDEYMNAAIYFKRWFDAYQPIIMAAEFPVYCLEPGIEFAGTVDLLCKIDTGLLETAQKKEPKRSNEYVDVLVDFKTGNGVYETGKMQVAAYEHCMPTRCKTYILHLGTKHKAKYNFIEIDNQAELFELFGHVHAIWQFENADQAGPRYIEIPYRTSLNPEQLQIESEVEVEDRPEETNPL